MKERKNIKDVSKDIKGRTNPHSHQTMRESS